MAVARVIGKTDTFEVVFDITENDVWKANIPLVLSGEYLMELYAYDDAGNVGFLATALFTVDTSNLCCHIEFIKYEAKASFLNDYDYDLEFVSDYACKVEEVLPCLPS